VAAGGLALGFVASRLLKASSSQRYEQRAGAPRTTTTAGQLPPAGGTTAESDPFAPPTTPALDDPLRTPTRGGGL
jgi:hypothetical protein